MIILALSLLTTLLWLIFTPYSSIITLSLSLVVSLLLFIFAFIIKAKSINIIFCVVGIILGHLTLLPKLLDYQKAVHLWPRTLTLEINIVGNRSMEDSFLSAQISNVLTKDEDTSHYRSLIGKSIYIYNVNKRQQPFKLNEKYRVTLALTPLNSPHHLHQSPKRLHYLSKQIVANATPKSEFVYLKKTDYLTQIRLYVHHYFQSKPFAKREYLSALSIGIDDQLSPQDWQILRQTGTIHLISISGLHLTFIALWGFIIIRTTLGICMLRRIAPYKVAAIAAIGVAAGYALLAGFSIPTQRSLLIFTLAMLMLFTRFSILSLHNLAFALWLILLFSPLSILSVGLWLSFSAVLMLMLISRYQTSLTIRLFMTQIMVSLVVMPLTLSYFGEISLISPLANLFAIPWTTLFILPSLLIGIVLLPLMPALADYFFYFSHHCLQFMLLILEWISQIPFSSLILPKLPFIEAIIITILLILLVAPHKRYWKLIYGMGIIGILSINYFPKNQTPALFILPVGEGLSVFMHTKEANILFDTGNYFRRFDAGRDVINPSLQALGIHTLTYIFLSQKNQQHTGGTRSVRTQFPKTKLVVPQNMVDLVDNSVPCETFTLKKPPLTISVIPEITQSCALLINYQHLSFWLLADISPQEWALLLARYPLPNFLLFPNQGRQQFFDIDPLLSASISPFILFSTKTIHEKYLRISLEKNSANAYQGWVMWDFRKNRLFQHNDERRFWWMR